MKRSVDDATTVAGELTEAWLSNWLQPWKALGEWNALWADPWRRWLKTVPVAPAAWLPALAGNRRERQPLAIEFFLPWLPRIEAEITPLRRQHSDEDAVRVMLRAVLPASVGGDWLQVDATVTRHHGGSPWVGAVEPPDEVLTDATTDAKAPRTRKPG
ncbi:hypothetical protein AGMMS50225_14320 [Betaproteobacteria bacterium]|nr:hypothetical protein AGMMS50225_14320 [Betaproteobacteria bacterium]